MKRDEICGAFCIALVGAVVMVSWVLGDWTILVAVLGWAIIYVVLASWGVSLLWGSRRQQRRRQTYAYDVEEVDWLT